MKATAQKAEMVLLGGNASTATFTIPYLEVELHDQTPAPRREKNMRKIGEIGSNEEDYKRCLSYINQAKAYFLLFMRI